MTTVSPAQEHRICLEVPSRFDHIKVAITVVEGICRILNLDQDQTNELVISLVEACNNSIEHGYGCDKDKTVRVEITFSGFRVEIEVIDWGKGFDITSVREYNPEDRQELFNYRGRGIFMMKRFMNLVECFRRDDGATVTRMVKNLD